MISAFFHFVAQRLRSQIGLVACLSLGVILAVALAAAIPVFVTAVQLRVLRNELLNLNTAVSRTGSASYLPFALQFSFATTNENSLSHDAYRKLDAFMRERIEPRTILPIIETATFAQTPPWRLLPLPGSPTARKYDGGRATGRTLAQPTVDSMSNFSRHAVIEEGEPLLNDGALVASAAGDHDGAPVPVLISRAFAERYGAQAGDTFLLSMTQTRAGPGGFGGQVQETIEAQVPVRITGVWLPKDPRADYWGLSPDTLKDSLIVTPKDFDERIAPLLNTAVRSARWQYILDVSRLSADSVAPFTARARQLQREVFRENRNVILVAALLDALDRYLVTSRELLLLLVIFSVPVFAIVFYFVVLVAGMVVRQQEGEITTLRSRGASIAYILGLYVAQSLAIIAIALLIGIPLGYGLASVMAGTLTFLQFGPPQPVEFSLFNAEGQFVGLPQSFRFALIAAGLSIAGVLAPAIGAARQNVVSQYADRGRNTQRPLWQRLYLDVLLLIPALYGYYQLRGQGSIVLPGADASGSRDPLSDPVRFLLPVLLLTALGLLVVRLFPMLMAALSKITERSAPTPVVLAWRELARSPKETSGPLVLLILTMGIAVYGASIAKTLDEHLRTTTLLRVGADIRLVETGESSKITLAPGELAQGKQISDPNEPEYWTFLPPEGHLDIPGVTAFARAAQLPAYAREYGSFGIKQVLLGVDWRAFQAVAARAYRDELSTQSFGALMNLLANSRDSALVSRDFLKQHNLEAGDPLVLIVNPGRESATITYTIRGGFDYFPIITRGKDDPIAYVVNLEYTFEQLGKDMPYDVLLTTKPGVSGYEVAREAIAREYIVKDVYDAQAAIREAQAQPARQGLFGVLTTGFLAATLLTAIGFVLYALVSFRRRAIELGVLRTIGLSEGQMATYLILTQAMLVLLGALAGSLLGALASYLFIPFLQVGGSLVNQVPPFIVRVAWGDLVLMYLAVAAALAVALGGTLLLLRRLKVFEAIKLGMVT
jgi:putative ABC transport system permease protein